MCEPNCVATLDAKQKENVAFFDEPNLLTKRRVGLLFFPIKKRKLNVEKVEMQTKCNYIHANVVYCL